MLEKKYTPKQLISYYNRNNLKCIGTVKSVDSQKQLVNIITEDKKVIKIHPFDII
tara:strand:- start:248 stop:412 length:165 start_codon:yes stop_codon:yes gene_type:complete